MRLKFIFQQDNETKKWVTECLGKEMFRNGQFKDLNPTGILLHALLLEKGTVKMFKVYRDTLWCLRWTSYQAAHPYLHDFMCNFIPSSEPNSTCCIISIKMLKSVQNAERGLGGGWVSMCGAWVAQWVLINIYLTLSVVSTDWRRWATHLWLTFLFPPKKIHNVDERLNICLRRPFKVQNDYNQCIVDYHQIIPFRTIFNPSQGKSSWESKSRKLNLKSVFIQSVTWTRIANLSAHICFLELLYPLPGMFYFYFM